jgi:hypothetical protein
MKDCTTYRRLLPLWSGGDLGPADARRLEGHFLHSSACRAERDKYLKTIEIARNVYAAEVQLPSFVRTRIASGAAAACRQGWSRYTAPFVVLPGGRRAGLIASLAASLLALVALPMVLRERPIPPAQPPVAAGIAADERIDMRLVGGKVRLAWSDGDNASYRVYKSSDPKGLAGAEVHSVRGTVWVDHNPASSPIVYYRIEPGDSPHF